MPTKKFPKTFINKIIGKSNPKTKRRKRRTRKTPINSKINTRRSTSGIVNLPIDVKSPEDIPTFLKALQSKNLTIILVYANWCPHCHTIMPHFDAASKNPNNTVSSVKIDEKMLSNVNDAIKKNINSSANKINVDGYPSIIIVNNNAEKITDVNPVNDTKTLTSVMEKAGNLAQESNLHKENLNKPHSIPAGLSNTHISQNESLHTDEPELIYNRNSNINNGHFESPIGSSNDEQFESPIDNSNDEQFESPIDNSNVDINVVEPPVLESNEVSLNNKKKKVGGSLMSIMERSAYTLAPTAALLAASSFIKTKKRKKYKKQR